VRPLFQKNFYKLNSEAGTLFEHYFDEMEAKTSDLSAADPSLGLVNKSSVSKILAIYKL